MGFYGTFHARNNLMTATDCHIYFLPFPSLLSIASSFRASSVCHVHEKRCAGAARILDVYLEAEEGSMVTV